MASGGGAGTIFTGQSLQSYAKSGGGGGAQQSFVESIKNLGYADFIATFGGEEVNPDFVIPCCSFFYIEKTLKAAIADIELFKSMYKKNPTLIECLTPILGTDLTTDPESITRSAHTKIFCATALFGNHYMDILATNARSNLWASLETIELPDQFIADLTTHSGMGKVKPGNYPINTEFYITTAYPTTSAFYHPTLNIYNPELLLLEDPEYLKSFATKYFYFLKKDLLIHKRAYDKYLIELDAATEKCKREKVLPTTTREMRDENYNNAISIMIKKNQAKDAIKSLIKILQIGRSYELRDIKNMNTFETFLYGDENGSTSGSNTTIVALIPRASLNLYNFLRQYFALKLSDTTDSEFPYYDEMYASMPMLEKYTDEKTFIIALNDWIIEVQTKKRGYIPYMFAFAKCSDAPEKLQTPMYELIVAQAIEKGDVNSIMSLSALLFINMEKPSGRLINELLRETSKKDVLRFCPTMSLIGKNNNFGIIDMGCKAAKFTAYEILIEYSQGELGSSLDVETQRALDYANFVINSEAEQDMDSELSDSKQQKIAEIAEITEITEIVENVLTEENQTGVNTEIIMLEEMEDDFAKSQSHKTQFYESSDANIFEQRSQSWGGRKTRRQNKKRKTKRRRPQKKSTRKKRR